MNTETREITAADVVAFFQEHVKKLSTAVGKSYVALYCELVRGGEVQWKTYVPDSGHHSADDFEAAMEQAIRFAAPEAVAKTKREAAAKLLAEADALAPSPDCGPNAPLNSVDCRP